MLSKIVIITNIPSPYRVLLFNRLASDLDGALYIIYYQETEPNRSWGIPNLEHRAIFLKRTIFSKINFHPDIFAYFEKEKPKIIITTGFTITTLLTYIYTKLKRKKFVVFTDSWLHSVNNLKFLNRLIRRVIIPRSDAFICVGSKGKEFLISYGAKRNSIFISPLAIDNNFYSSFYQPSESKKFDIMFSGQFIDRKMPFFIIDLLKELKKKKNNIKLLIIGSGPLEGEIIRLLENNKINYLFPGFIKQEDLPRFYASSRLLLFPTKDDPWGIVANEACAVGTPVVTCENAGAANDLIIHNFNGFVLPLSINIWVEHISKLLEDLVLYDSFSKNSLAHVKSYSVEHAANGIKDAINYLSYYERT